mmetsp:Transcript_20000/g.30892  ORF Transcript_20000/g.30892 Transcript_20000/m.30892 type:complete len:515 (-) Transcript_20000:158-1702(-)
MEQNTASSTTLTERLLEEEIVAPPVLAASCIADSERDEDDGREEQIELLVQHQTWETGEIQPNKCRDWFWACLFLAQLATVVAIAIAWGIPALNYAPEHDLAAQDEHVSEPIQIHFDGVVYTCLLAGVGAFLISLVAFAVMIRWSEVLVQISVVFSMLSSMALFIVCITTDEAGGAMTSFVLFTLAACYTISVWSRIPFAASNLKTATTAVRTNLGVTLVGFVLVIAAFCWTAIWLLSLIGIYMQTAQCDDDTGVCHSKLSGWVFMLFLLSYYWTQQVTKNVIHVTVAGVVGTWWIAPTEASSICSRSIGDSFLRSVTTSFGSICFGSLLVSIIQLIHSLLRQARREGQDNCLLCILECLVSYLERIAEFFNKFAYVYVGIYGYTYLEAGKNVMTLFRARGWTTIVNDNLLSNTLGLVSLVIGGLSGCLGIILDEINPSWLSLFEDQSHKIAFVIAFLIGIVVATLLMSIVASAVDTTLVLFAEKPRELVANYPDLSTQMTEAWKEAYPEECGF